MGDLAIFSLQKAVAVEPSSPVGLSEGCGLYENWSLNTGSDEVGMTTKYDHMTTT